MAHSSEVAVVQAQFMIMRLIMIEGDYRRSKI
jgi:hypothetical protein